MPPDTTAVADTAEVYRDLAVALGIDLVAICIFSIGLYFKRHARKDLAVVFTFFNLCLFTVIVVIQMTEVAAAVGFGLFAILSIIRLRSEPFDNTEIGYFFGALVLGLVNGIGTTHLGLTIGLNVVVVAAMSVLDHPRALSTAARRHVILDVVHTDPAELRRVLSDRLRAPVVDVSIISIDYVRDSMELDVRFVERPNGLPTSSRPWPAPEMVGTP